MILSITTPPPSVNAMYVNIPGKGRAKSRAYKAWLQTTGWEIKAKRPKQITGPYSIAIEVQRDYWKLQTPPRSGELSQGNL